MADHPPHMDRQFDSLSKQLSAAIKDVLTKHMQIPNFLRTIQTVPPTAVLADHATPHPTEIALPDIFEDDRNSQPDPTVNPKTPNHETTMHDTDNTEQQQISFQSALLGPITRESPIAQAYTSDMRPQRKGDFISVKVDDALVRERVSQLQATLIGKLSLSQGDTPYSLDDL